MYVVSFTSFEDELATALDLFDGEFDLEDLGRGKLREEGGAPRLSCVALDLPDLLLSFSVKLIEMPARLLLDPTVSTFVLPCYERVHSSSGSSDNDECILASVVSHK